MEIIRFQKNLKPTIWSPSYNENTGVVLYIEVIKTISSLLIFFGGKDFAHKNTSHLEVLRAWKIVAFVV